MKQLQKYGIAAGVILLFAAILLLPDVKWFFMPKGQMVEDLLSKEPAAVTEIPIENIEISLYSGNKQYYKGMILAEHNGAYLSVLDICTTVFGDEQGELSDGATNLHLEASIQVKDGKLSFLSPFPVRECFAEDEPFVFTAGIDGKEIPCELEDIYVSDSIVGPDISIVSYLFLAETMEEVKEYIFSSEDGMATIYLDQLYYYEYDLTWLQEMILGGA